MEIFKVDLCKILFIFYKNYGILSMVFKKEVKF